MSAINQQLVERINHLNAEQQRRVLDFIDTLESTPRTPSARELLALPPAEHDAILRAQLERAADEDFETFEAYSEEDLDATP